MFGRLLEYNRPRILMIIGILTSVISGVLMPIFGGICAKMLFVLLDSYNLP